MAKDTIQPVQIQPLAEPKVRTTVPKVTATVGHGTPNSPKSAPNGRVKWQQQGPKYK